MSICSLESGSPFSSWQGSTGPEILWTLGTRMAIRFQALFSSFRGKGEGKILETGFLSEIQRDSLKSVAVFFVMKFG